MILFSSIVNALTVLVGGVVGTLIGSRMSERFSKSIMQGLALCVMLIGLQGAMQGKNPLITILSMTLGIVIGELLRLQHHMDRFSLWIQQKVTRGKSGDNRIAEGFVSCALMVCVGAMAVTGSLDAGLKNDHSVLLAKSLIDLISTTVLASTMGIGVALAFIVVFVYQGGIALCAGLLAPFLQADALAEMTCVGSLLIIAIALNMLGLTKFKLLNFLPAIPLSLLFYIIFI